MIIYLECYKVFIHVVPTFSMIEWMFLLAGIVEFVLPIGIAIYLWKKYGVSWIVFVFGAVMFGLSLVRIPLNLVVQNNLNQYFVGTALLVVGALFPSLTAGLFEEGCRFLGYKYLFRPDRRNWHNGLMYGAGHGGIEAIVLVALNHLLIFLFLQVAPGILPAGVLAQILALPAYMPWVAALERVFALCIQIGLSIVVLQCFVRGSRKYLGLAIGFHTAVDFVVILAARESIFLAEAAAGVFAVIGLYFIWKCREKTE